MEIYFIFNFFFRSAAAPFLDKAFFKDKLCSSDEFYGAF